MSCSISSTVGPAVADLADQLLQRHLLGRVHPGGRLVEQQQLGVRWPAPGRSPAGAGRRRRGSWPPRRPRRGCRRTSSSSRATARRRAPRPGARGRPSTAPGTLVRWRASAPTITFSRAVMLVNSRMFWNVRAMPRPGDLVGLAPGEVDAREPDCALGRLVHAGHDVEHRRLAGAVGPDQREDLALVDVEVELGDGDHAAEADREARRSSTRPPGRPARRRSAAGGSRPCRTGSAARPVDATSAPSLPMPPWPSFISARRWRDGSRPWGRKIIMTTSSAAEDQHPRSEKSWARGRTWWTWRTTNLPKLAPRRYSGSQADQEGAEDDAGHVARSAEHDGGQDQDRQQELEVVRRDGDLLGGEDHAGHAADRRPDGERPQLELEGGHAHQLGRILVLADRLPGPAHPAALEPAADEDHQDDRGQDQVVVRLRVEHAVGAAA